MVIVLIETALLFKLPSRIPSVLKIFSFDRALLLKLSITFKALSTYNSSGRNRFTSLAY